MRKRPHLRWIEEAEARRVREFALLRHAPSEPPVSIVLAVPGPTWLRWLRAPIMRVPSAVLNQRPSPDRYGNSV
jgi:hypothetical protein